MKLTHCLAGLSILAQLVQASPLASASTDTYRANVKDADDFDIGNIKGSRVLAGSKGTKSQVKVLPRQATPSSNCDNSATDRSCWSNGYSVNTDFDSSWPSTGVTRSYHLDVTQTTCNPDGQGDVTCYLYNNQLPGPTIWANWGDYVSVTVTNNIKDNGTSTHFHGIRQLGTNDMDGVNGITECPLAPGRSTTYTWQATQYGSTWYHSHYTVQYGGGLFGSIVIDGPSSADYDVDLGPITLSDWFDESVWDYDDQAYINALGGTGAPASRAVLINGTTAGGSKGEFVTTVQAGKKYKLRLINTSVDTPVRFSIDGHSLQVISSDLVPVNPVVEDSVMVGIAQRYDVVFTANQTVGNYNMRATLATACGAAGQQDGAAILRYEGASTSAAPNSTSSVTDTSCSSPPLVPVVQTTTGDLNEFNSQAKALDVGFNSSGVSTNGQNILVWNINGTGINVDWSKPTLSYVMEKNTSYPESLNLIEVPTEGTWTYWILQNTPGALSVVAHPFHLHGHDFYILGQGNGVFDPQNSPATLDFSNPVRRDTHYLPSSTDASGSWVVLSFEADNPGAWLMHCHIATHIAGGLGVQFLEAPDQITLPGAAYSDQCQAWDTYYQTAVWKKDDSGL